MTQKRKQRIRFWLQNPRCRNCGTETVLPEYLSYILNVPMQDICRHLPKKILHSLATIDHVFNRFDPERKLIEVNKGHRHQLLCYRCNSNKGHKDYLKLPERQRLKMSHDGAIKALEKQRGEANVKES